MITHPSLFAALLYCVWTLTLLGMIGCLRLGVTVFLKKPANSFAVTGEDVSPFSARLCRAHANCYENLPVFLGLIFVAQILQQSELTDPLALACVAARIAQSTTHILSTSVMAVTIRFVFFLIQFVILACWSASLAMHFLGS